MRADLKTLLSSTSCIMLIAIGALCLQASEPATEEAKPTTALDVTMQTLDGEDVNLAEKYADQVVLVVNVASKCGLTPQYEALQALHAEYSDKGLTIVGVPCNQFNGQEPGDAKAIHEFCTKNYGVEFDMLAKVDVNGKDACEMYAFLTSKKTNPKFAGKIQWNFEKFLLAPDGEVLARFSPRVSPDDKEVIDAIEEALAKLPKKTAKPSGEKERKKDAEEERPSE